MCGSPINITNAVSRKRSNKKLVMPLCAGTTKQGSPCRNKVADEGDLCYVHGSSEYMGSPTEVLTPLDLPALPKHLSSKPQPKTKSPEKEKEKVKQKKEKRKVIKEGAKDLEEIKNVKEKEFVPPKPFALQPLINMPKVLETDCKMDRWVKVSSGKVALRNPEEGGHKHIWMLRKGTYLEAFLHIYAGAIGLATQVVDLKQCINKRTGVEVWWVCEPVKYNVWEWMKKELVPQVASRSIADFRLQELLNGVWKEAIRQASALDHTNIQHFAFFHSLWTEGEFFPPEKLKLRLLGWDKAVVTQPRKEWEKNAKFMRQNKRLTKQIKEQQPRISLKMSALEKLVKKVWPLVLWTVLRPFLEKGVKQPKTGKIEKLSKLDLEVLFETQWDNVKAGTISYVELFGWVRNLTTAILSPHA